MSHSSFGEFWCSLLFNLVSIPFLVLLIALIANQTMSVRDYSAANAETGTTTYVGDTLF